MRASSDAAWDWVKCARLLPLLLDSGIIYFLTLTTINLTLTLT